LVGVGVRVAVDVTVLVVVGVLAGGSAVGSGVVGYSCWLVGRAVGVAVFVGAVVVGVGGIVTVGVYVFTTVGETVSVASLVDVELADGRL
jgi:hypothetical protein